MRPPFSELAVPKTPHPTMADPKKRDGAKTSISGRPEVVWLNPFPPEGCQASSQAGAGGSPANHDGDGPLKKKFLTIHEPAASFGYDRLHRGPV